MPISVFLSHSSRDDAWVERLRRGLEGLNVPVWVDSRQLRAGDALEPEIREAIQRATHVVAVISANAAQSDWLRREIDFATDSGKRIIAVVRAPLDVSAVKHWFDPEPVALVVDEAPDSLDRLLLGLRIALGLMAPRDLEPQRVAPLAPIADLIADVTKVTLVGQDDTLAVSASVKLRFQPAGETDVFDSSRRFAPESSTISLGTMQTYPIWPYGRLRERAAGVESRLRVGRALFEQIAVPATAQIVRAWRSAPGERRFTVNLSSEALSSSLPAAGQLAASALLALPWELLHDGRGYLFHGARPVRVRRCVANDYPQEVVTSDPPLRVLIVSPRPEADGIAFIDHRISSQPIVDALSIWERWQNSHC